MGYSVPRVLAGFLASAAMVGAFVCAVLVIQPLAGADPRWPHRADDSASAKTLRLPVALAVPRADVVPAATALAPTVAVRVRVPGIAVHRAAKRAPRRPVQIDRVIAPSTQHAPVRPASHAVPTAAPATPSVAPSPAPLAPVADTVSSTARTAGQAVAPVSPEAGSTVEQAGAAVAKIVGGP